MTEPSPSDDGLIRRHDRNQFEIKLNHDFSREEPRDTYTVETYFFIPNNLDINEVTYSKADFYRDRILYLRFKSPSFALSALADPANDRSPLNVMGDKLAEYTRHPTRPNADTLEYEIKLLGCTLKSALRDHVRRTTRALRTPTDPSAETDAVVSCNTLIEEFLASVHRIVSSYRLHRETILRTPDTGGIRSTFAFTDEYISLLIGWRALVLLKSLENSPHRDRLSHWKARIAGLIRDENSHRLNHYPGSVIAKEGDNELFLFRLSVLKKFVSSVLYLNVRRIEEGRGLEQLALALAAGLAMLFASAVAFYYQREYGTLSLTFFIALVVSYMLKDRIKAISQLYFQNLLARTLFDETMHIHHTFKGLRIGTCRESVRFVNERDIDPAAVKLRNRDHLTEIENDWRREKVLCYIREIKLKDPRPSLSTSRKTGLTDIFRLNLSRFLARLDESETILLDLNGNTIEERIATRVYHLNIVLKYVSGSTIRFERFRLVLTKEGIKRTESVASEVVPQTAP